MTAPSWLPSWPATWPDLESAYRRVIPGEWPANLFRVGMNAYDDLQALGDSLAQVRKLVEWMLRRVWPDKDTDELFLDRWEASLGIASNGAAAIRAWWIKSILGLSVGTLTRGQARAIMAGAYPTTSGATVVEVGAPAVDVDSVTPSTAFQWAFCQTNRHFYESSANGPPDDRIARWILGLITPAGALWTYGSYNTGDYSASLSSPGSAGYSYDHCTYQ